MRLIVVEDDDKLREKLCVELEKADYAVDAASNALDAQHLLDHETYDAVVMDIGLPDRNGLALLTALRANGCATAILLLTARDSWQEKVEGFRAGADDYLTKPFHVEELLARLKALIRRSHKAQLGDALHVAGLSLNEERQTVTLNGAELLLKGVEYRLLRYLMHHPGKILTRTQLYQHIYDDVTENESNVIEVHINHLRNKIGKEFITTRRGQGYVFGLEVS